MPPRRLRQSAHTGGSPDLPDLTPIPPQTLSAPPAQLPEVSSPDEVESMMDVDDTIQHSPSPPPSPPPPFLPLLIPQVDLTVDAIERTLSNVTVSSSPTYPTHPPHAFESVEDSEPEGGLSTEDRDAPQAGSDDLDPPPSPSPSSPSHHTPLSGHPTPIVRYLLYGGPDGIFRDANASIVQHTPISPQDPNLQLATLPSAHQDRETELEAPPTVNAITPHTPDPQHGSVVAKVNNTMLLLLIATSHNLSSDINGP